MNENKKKALLNCPTPCYVMDEEALVHNLAILQEVEQQTGCHILLAQKAFSAYHVYPLIARYLSGTTASGLYEARLAREEMGNREVHVYAPAYKEEDFDRLTQICDHIVFNSLSQWEHFRRKAAEHPEISFGLRINPAYSEIKTAIYNPCIEGSRLGIPVDQLKEADLNGISGLHFHTLCEQGADTLERTLAVVEEKCGQYLSRMKWLNFGGGHHITLPNYDVPRLLRCIRHFQERYGLTIYIEPGEAVAIHAGYLVCTVLDIIHNGMDIAIVDTSAACHMPDVLEMPYRPSIIGAEEPQVLPYTYRLGAPTCLAGDVIGDYSFERPLSVGDKLIFTDMAMYTMVKNNTFNGMPLPSIYLLHTDNRIELLKQFGYEDFKSRL